MSDAMPRQSILVLFKIIRMNPELTRIFAPFHALASQGGGVPCARRATPLSFRIESNSLTCAQFFKLHNARMLFRTLATLAFAVSFDLFFYGGKYTHAVQTMALSIYRHF